MTRTFAVTLAAIILVPTFAFSSTPDRSCIKLFNNCHVARKYIDESAPSNSTDREKMQVAACVGYFEGFTDREAISNIEGTNHRFCPPTDANMITAEEKILVFLQWADRNPEKLHIDRVNCVTEAFADAYPCPLHK
jgi:Rap1a immunity proteins